MCNVCNLRWETGPGSSHTVGNVVLLASFVATSPVKHLARTAENAPQTVFRGRGTHTHSRTHTGTQAETHSHYFNFAFTPSSDLTLSRVSNLWCGPTGRKRRCTCSTPNYHNHPNDLVLYFAIGVNGSVCICIFSHVDSRLINDRQ